jgi:prophage maintenance system killer protein/predicted XRE-type DNA-binding protein
MSEIVIYEDGVVSLEATVEKDTLWLSQQQIADLFEVQRPAITKHLGNIFKSDELDEKVVCSILEHTTKHGAMSSRTQKSKTKIYSLDAIISIGYRVNSKKATEFRIWATGILKEHLLQGYTLNEKRLQQKGLKAFNQAIALLKNTIHEDDLECDEAKRLFDVIVGYGRSWSLLEGYDEDKLSVPFLSSEQKFSLGYSEATRVIAELKKDLIQKREATVLFGREKAGELDGIIGNIYQTFGGDDLIPSVEEKAASLLYYIIKDHPFVDGNKRIGAFLFILFLQKNNILYRNNGEPKINDNALVALALMTAKSLPEQKDTVIALVVNMLVEG